MEDIRFRAYEDLRLYAELSKRNTITLEEAYRIKSKII